MRLLAGIAAAVVLVLALGAVASSAAPEKRGGKTVKVGDDFFDPTKLKVSPGTKVKWKWVGSDEHNVVKTSGPGGGFESPITDTPGVNLTHKFTAKGKYQIICTIHENMTMKVKVK